MAHTPLSIFFPPCIIVQTAPARKQNKEQEAKEELKRRAKQLEMQRREATRRGIPASNFGAQMAAASAGGYGGGGGSSASAMGGGGASSAAVHRENLSQAAAGTDGVIGGDGKRSGAAAGGAAKGFKGKGMQLGKKKLGASASIQQAVSAAAAAMEVDEPPSVDPAVAAHAHAHAAPSSSSSGGSARPAALPSTPTTPSAAAAVSHTPASAAAASDASSLLPRIAREAVHVLVKERVTLQADRDGGLKSLEIKGDLELRVSDAAAAKVRLSIADPSSSGSGGLPGEMNWKTHPHVDKALWASERVIALKDPKKPFPVNQGLGVLRWRNTSLAREEQFVPLSITCWPSPSADGGAEVTIEFNTDALEAAGSAAVLRDARLVIPLPAGVAESGGGGVEIGEVSQGEAAVAQGGDVLVWQLGEEIKAGESGSLEFTVSSGVQGEDVSAFFPVQVDFWSEESISKVQVSSCFHSC